MGSMGEKGIINARFMITKKKKRKKLSLPVTMLNAFRMLILTIMGCMSYCVSLKDGKTISEKLSELA